MLGNKDNHNDLYAPKEYVKNREENEKKIKGQKEQELKKQVK